MALSLIPLDSYVAVQGYLANRTAAPLSPAEERHAAELLERCVRTAEVLVTFALYLAGRPSPN